MLGAADSVAAKPAAPRALSDSGNVTILADSSLSLPLTELARLYSSQRKTSLNITYGAGAVQLQQLLGGSAGDLFIATQPAFFVKLRTEGVMDIYSQRAICRNRLALVGPKKMQPVLTFKTLKENADSLLQKTPGLHLLVPDATLAGGDTVQELLRRSGLQTPFQDYIKPASDEGVLFENVKRNGSYAFTLYTDALRADAAGEIALLDVVPQEFYTPIRYEAAVIAGENMPAARKFLDFLSTPEARSVFRKYGFDL